MADSILKYVVDGYVATDYVDEYNAYEGASLQAGSFAIAATAYVDQGGGYVINDYIAPDYVGEIVSADATLTSQFTLSADSIKLRPGVSLKAGSFAVTADAGRTRPGQSAMSAFNATVYAGTRLRYADATMSTLFTSDQTALRIRPGSNGIVTWDEIPVTGIQLYDETDISLDVIGLDSSPDMIQDFVFSVWAKSDKLNGIAQSGTILSARGTAANEESAFKLRLSGSGLNVSWSTSAGNTNGWSTLLTMSGVDTTEWHHYWVKCRRTTIAGPLYRYIVELYVDGSLQATNNVDISTLNGDPANTQDPITVGAYRNLDTYSDTYRGVLAQAWLSTDSVSGFDVVSDFYDAGWVDLGSDGTKSSTLTMPPDWYEPWDYPYTTRTNNADATNYPTRLLNPAPSIFTVTAVATVSLVLGQATLSSEFAQTAETVRLRPGDSALTAQVTLDNLGGRLETASALLASEFTILPAPTTELFGEASLSALASTTLAAFAGKVGDIDIVTTTTMSATAYDFTKAEAAVSSEFTTNIVATALIPVKGNMVTDAFAQVSADAVVKRGGLSVLTAVSTLTPTAVRIFDSTIAMQALAVTLSAGRLIEFRDENTLIVEAETRSLLVNWEDRLFKVAKENRINTTIRETTTVVVEPENGVLLLDEEQ